MTPDRDRRLLRGSPIVLVALAATAFGVVPASAPPGGAGGLLTAADVRGAGPAGAATAGAGVAAARVPDDLQSIRFDPVGFRTPAAVPVALPEQPPVTTTALPGTAAAAAIEFALAQRGLPYVWGGDGPQQGDEGFDCSGLTTAAYAYAGVALPRTAHTQYYRGPHVPAGAGLLPGDLVFYGVPERVHHVGLYLGNGMMVNAPRRGKPVQIARVRYPGDTYLGATRPAAGVDAAAEGLLTTPQLPVPVPAQPSPSAPPAPEEFPAPAVPEAELALVEAAPAPAAAAPGPVAPTPAPTAPLLGPGLPPVTTSPLLGPPVPPPATPGPGLPPPAVTPPGAARPAPTPFPTTPPVTTPPVTAPPPTTPLATSRPPVTTAPPATTPPPATAPPVTTPPPAAEPEPAPGAPRPASLDLPSGRLDLARAERGADGLPVAPSAPGAGGLRFAEAEGGEPARAVVALHPDAPAVAEGATITWRGAGEPIALTVRSARTVPTADAAQAAQGRGGSTRLVLVRTDPATGQTLLVIAE